MGFDFDVLIIGSGFGGSVSALRLVEKGYRVGVLEAGKRFVESPEQVRDDDTAAYARTSWRAREFLWAPQIGCYGIQRIHTLDNVMILAGAGVGGGSLNYANTLYRPLDAFYRDRQWAHITDWKAELAPFYDQAGRMLGAVEYARMTPADERMKEVADELGVGESFHKAPVGVFLGAAGQREGEEVADPYFGGAGPRRRTCRHCGECMTGCRHDAKNTLVKNYLYLAERAGARVIPMATVRAVRPMGQGYALDVVRTGARQRGVNKITAEQVIVAAGTYGTQRLLHRMRLEGLLPGLSDRLGHLTRTNSEALLGASAHDDRIDYSEGVAITSSIHPNDHTHIEPVRYGRGSNAMSLLQTALTDGGEGSRLLKVVRELGRNPRLAARLLRPSGWSERTIIALVMQSLDNSITVRGERDRLGRFRLRSAQGHGRPNPEWIPEGNQAARVLAEKVGGDPGGSWGDVFGRPLTAHFLGGCAIGDSPATGVIDAYHRVYGHPGLHIVDGSAVSANLGVNPALTITAQAERALAMWPNAGEADTRPALGSAYRQIAPVAPRSPVVPVDAPGALRLPVVDVRR
ncbi:GMC oxidoreductase [Blastococcus sp. Marseille-P5729]|uniref:GMC oxidoreductase n=1 Tax=Blastococcus sp. Marseille-P5729 TaxID=2086582 RepID=UPI000D10ADDB|nr:GMC family oxidoreductase [Blastococcus sp. Marseille-P5729]